MEFLLHVVVFLSCTMAAKTESANETEAIQWLEDYDNLTATYLYNAVNSEWNYNTNITEENLKNQTRYALQLSSFKNSKSKEAKTTFNWTSFSPRTKRLFKLITKLGVAAMEDEDKKKKLEETLGNMTKLYSVATVKIDGKDKHLEPGLTQLMANSRNYSLLLQAWKGWRDASTKNMKNLYAEFVNLSNEAVRVEGWNDTGEYWRSMYEDENFENDVEQLLKELHPLYKLVHAYTRLKLKEKYKCYFPASKLIPAHLLGNMWAQSWSNIGDLLTPFQNKTKLDITPTLKAQNYTAKQMFKVSEEFFTSLGLLPMPDLFWEYSMMKRPNDGRHVVCHASAWDFYNQKDFRIKMCTDITMDDLATIHHEMGHIQYFLQYANQSVPFRDGANPGFHEAVGDTLALSVVTPGHLEKIGLLRNYSLDNETDINFLLAMAIDKIAFLPFGYLIDQWRWEVFSGRTPKSRYNQRWWDLRCKYQGLYPPVERTEKDFDPGAKFHIPNNTPYIRYFVSFVIQFQFHKTLCEAANYTGPLHRCDIYGSTEAGTKLREMLAKGSSERWQDVLKSFNNMTKLDLEPLKEYFKPLTDWLEKIVPTEERGWDCSNVINEWRFTTPNSWLCGYNEEAAVKLHDRIVADWNFRTNITEANKDNMTKYSLIFSEFRLKKGLEAKKFNVSTYPASLKRAFKKITELGTSAMRNKTKEKRLEDLLSKMGEIYSSATVTVNGKTENLEPGLTQLMSKSRNYTLLKDVWQKWRNATGRKMKDIYEEYVALSNEALRADGWNDSSDYWISDYEDPDFKNTIENIWKKVLPFYKLLHAYTRKRLMDKYGESNFPPNRQIPAHLFGNMWAQEWVNIYDLLTPFRGKPTFDVTPVLKAQNYTVNHMFRTAEAFFVSLGLKPMPDLFWNNSMMERPKDNRKVVCHASAWDFANQKDFRIKMCTDITMDDLVTIHHEMGHVQYYIQYKDQPIYFRSGANHGFHEAIGDTLALSVATPSHLEKLGLLTSSVADNETVINFLLKMALERIVFLPFAYLMDQWRWSVYSGEIKKPEYNRKWWDLRCKYQGLTFPVGRSEEDFDPGAKYHIANDVSYIRYFVARILQFQFHKALCKEANFNGPLHNCDIYNSSEAGQKLGEALRKGSSKPWQDTLKCLTNQTEMDVQPLLDYFKPLIDWLQKNVSEIETGWSCDDTLSSVKTASVTTVNEQETTTALASVTEGCLISSIIPLLASLIAKFRLF